MILRSGMWVHDGKSVGILFQMDVNVGVVHFVDKTGSTSATGTLPLAKLRRAKVSEIPAPRLAGVPAATLARLGYEE